MMAEQRVFDYESQGLLHEMFIRQARETPDRMAVVSPGENIEKTYRELDHMTEVLAQALRIRGVKEDCIVGIYMEKCLNYTAAYIAALRAGQMIFGYVIFSLNLLFYNTDLQSCA